MPLHSHTRKELGLGLALTQVSLFFDVYSGDDCKSIDSGDALASQRMINSIQTEHFK